MTGAGAGAQDRRTAGGEERNAARGGAALVPKRRDQPRGIDVRGVLGVLLASDRGALATVAVAVLRSARRVNLPPATA